MGYNVILEAPGVEWSVDFHWDLDTLLHFGDFLQQLACGNIGCALDLALSFLDQISLQRDNFSIVSHVVNFQNVNPLLILFNRLFSTVSFLVRGHLAHFVPEILNFLNPMIMCLVFISLQNSNWMCDWFVRLKFGHDNSSKWSLTRCCRHYLFAFWCAWSMVTKCLTFCWLANKRHVMVHE